MIENPPIIDVQNLPLERIRQFNMADNAALIHEINQKYLYWDKVKYHASQGVNPELLWLFVKLSRKTNAKTIRFGNYNFTYILYILFFLRMKLNLF